MQQRIQIQKQLNIYAMLLLLVITLLGKILFAPKNLKIENAPVYTM